MKNNNNIFTIPNILSLVRIGMIPFIVWTYCFDKTYLSAILTVTSGFTDVVDGYIARRFNMISPIGKALDPIADKLTIGFILIGLSIKNPLIIPLLVTFSLKEILMGIQGFMIIKRTGITYSSKWFGKLSTFVLYGTILAVMLWTGIPKAILYTLLSSCVFVVILSLVMYTVMNIKILMKVKK